MLSLARDGAERHSAALPPGASSEIKTLLAQFTANRAGFRLSGVAGLSAFLAADGPVGSIAEKILKNARPVRAVLFDKTEDVNWALGWHQDRTIAVKERKDVPGYGPWTLKSGMLHVAPPFEVLAGMVTLRAHLDIVDESNAPLRIIPGSHKLGRIAEGDIPDIASRCGTAICLADEGDIWAYSTPILHASAASATPSRRRVLQADFASCDLPNGLQWAGV